MNTHAHDKKSSARDDEIGCLNVTIEAIDAGIVPKRNQTHLLLDVGKTGACPGTQPVSRSAPLVDAAATATTATVCK